MFAPAGGGDQSDCGGLLAGPRPDPEVVATCTQDTGALMQALIVIAEIQDLAFDSLSMLNATGSVEWLVLDVSDAFWTLPNTWWRKLWYRPTTVSTDVATHTLLNGASAEVPIQQRDHFGQAAQEATGG